jgi:hypothetical protein
MPLVLTYQLSTLLNYIQLSHCEVATILRTSHKICSMFGGTLIECKNLCSISENKMLAVVGVLFFNMLYKVFLM